jgi:hypothetical protein
VPAISLGTAFRAPNRISGDARQNAALAGVEIDDVPFKDGDAGLLPKPLRRCGIAEVICSDGMSSIL